MNETPKRAGVLTWMLLTGAVAAPAAAQDSRAAEPTTQPTLQDAESERTGTLEEAEGSGHAAIQERPRRQEQQAKQIRDREREADQKRIQ